LHCDDTALAEKNDEARPDWVIEEARIRREGGEMARAKATASSPIAVQPEAATQLPPAVGTI